MLETNIKQKKNNHLLWFKVNGYIGVIGQDAIETSGILKLDLTGTINGKIPLIEFDFAELNNYTKRIINNGKKIILIDYT